MIKCDEVDELVVLSASVTVKKALDFIVEGTSCSHGKHVRHT